MAATDTQEIVGVFRTAASARAAAAAATRAAPHASTPRVGAHRDEIASLKGEMREELQHTTAGPGSIGPFTKEMTKGLGVGVVVGTIVGAVLGLPLGFIEWWSAPVGLRLVIAAAVGAAAGATVGFMAGGFTAKGPATPMAAERGTTVTIDVRTEQEIESVTAAMRQHDPIRIDLTTADGNAIQTLTTEEEELRDR